MTKQMNTKKEMELIAQNKKLLDIQHELQKMNEENNKIEDAGWHFSWMGDENRIKIKSDSFLHWDEISLQKDYVPKENSTDFLGRKNHILNKYPIENLPKEIFNIPNVKKFLSL